MQRSASHYTLLSVLFMLLVTLSSCDAIGTIFKAGAWAGIIGVFVVIALVVWLFGKLFGRK